MKLSTALILAMFLPAFSVPVLPAVADAGERPSSADLVVLRNGRQLTGVLTNEILRFRTAYAPLPLPRATLAVLHFTSDPFGPATVSTTSSNRFTGFLEDSSLTVRLESGAVISMAREEVQRVVFGSATAGGPMTGQQIWVKLRNGDLMSGEVREESISVVVSNRVLALDVGQLKSIVTLPSAPGACRVQFRDGARLEGELKTGVGLKLGAGPAIELYAGLIERLSSSFGEMTSDGFMSPEVSIAGSGPGPPFDLGLRGFVWIRPGSFLMGSRYDEKGRDLDEGPLTQMTIPLGFWMGKYEVTQAEYEKAIGTNPSNAADDPQLPVEKVSWSDAMEYCARLTRSLSAEGTIPAGFAFRLPTEAEWEYACRAGTNTRFSCGDALEDSALESYAWFAHNSDFRSHPVGTKRPNPWGLHDMHGNVWEWCLDRWERALPGGSQTNNPVLPSGTLRAARGGSWLYDPKSCRSANRDDYSTSNRCSDIGFRIVLAPAL